MTDNTQDVCVALMTAPSAEVAEQIVRELVESGVVACGNIISGVTSIFRWQGAVQREAEVMVVFKTVMSRTEQLVERVRALHPYDVPELLVLPVALGNRAYIDWVQASVSGLRGEKQR